MRSMLFLGFPLVLSLVFLNHAWAGRYLEVEKTLKGLSADDVAFEIQPTDVPGVLEARAGLQVLYVTADGQFIFNGPLIATATKENLTQTRLAEYRRTLLDELATLDTINYPADNSQHQITVITDIDCPYCRQLHQQLDTYNKAGIDITYVMLPRAGKGSESYFKTQNAICADKPSEAITAAMNGFIPNDVECDASNEQLTDQHLDMALRLGANSTPNILLADGTLIPGYQTAAQILQILNQ